MLGIEGKSGMVETLETRLGPSAATIMLEWPSHSPGQRQARAPIDRASPNSISWRLDDMLSTPFNPHIINYEPSWGFIVSKFTTYDGTRDPFDHIMHFM